MGEVRNQLSYDMVHLSIDFVAFLLNIRRKILFLQIIIAIKRFYHSNARFDLQTRVWDLLLGCGSLQILKIAPIEAHSMPTKKLQLDFSHPSSPSICC